MTPPQNAGEVNERQLQSKTKPQHGPSEDLLLDVVVVCQKTPVLYCIRHYV